MLVIYALIMTKEFITWKRLSDNHLAMLSVLLVCLILSTSCGKRQSGTESDETLTEGEEFHADNDIAMTIRSLADAIRVGEPLDSTEYDYVGVLTDGQGTPIYTDVQGSPGVWVVDVMDKKSVSIRNLYLGDLLPDDLESYILQNLPSGHAVEMDFEAHEAVNDDETQITLYDLDGGYLRFEIRAGIAPNGLEGPLLTIVLSADPPSGKI